MNHSICNTIYNKVSSGTFLYWYAVVALLLPNIALCFTERLSFWAGAANVLLPLALYMWFFSVARCPGKMVWWAFLFVFFAAFQLVLLYLFGTGVIAVDMFLNLVTTNPGEVMELLDNLVPAVVGVFVIYLPLLILAVIHVRKKHQISVSFQHHVRKWLMEVGLSASSVCWHAMWWWMITGCAISSILSTSATIFIWLSSAMRHRRITRRQAVTSGLMPGVGTMWKLLRCM